ncbi:hypothetical protein C7M84_007402 [Penaeus vannamei]|uniref:Uncharacterized protein n=1 Tax=Penaeus vannamei TaxID=6689 RepID=A0A3R7M7E7_PENVA|nr:hypothetical protein C7M84_007402 [Penaeus vannamei]
MISTSGSYGRSLLPSTIAVHSPLPQGVVIEPLPPKKVLLAAQLVETTLGHLTGTFNFQLQKFTTLHSQNKGVRGIVTVGQCHWSHGIGRAGVGVLEGRGDCSLGPRASLLKILVDEECPELAEDPLVGPISGEELSEGNDCLYLILREWVERVTSGLEYALADCPGRYGVNYPHRTVNLAFNITQTVAVAKPFDYRREMEFCSTRVTSARLKQDSALLPYVKRLKARTKALLNGRTITIVLKHRPPYVLLGLEGRKVMNATGILIELLHSLVATYNFSYTLKLPDDGQWGSIKDDGSWTGMVGEVFRNQQDMALGPTSITEEREKAIDFTQPFDFEPWDIMIPASIENVDLWLTHAFSGLVWLGLLLSSLAVAVALYTFAQVSAAPMTMYPRQVSPRLYSAHQYIFDTLSGLVTQGNNQPQTPSVRALAGWWWLFCVIIIASYSSKLISSITVRITAPAVTSMLDMVESRRILWTYQANSAMEELFKNSDPSSMFGKVGQLHREMPELIVSDFQEGVDAVREKKLAYVEVTLGPLAVVSVDASLLEYAIAGDLAIHGVCRMSLVRDPFFSTRFGMILQRGSPYRDAFSLAILEMIQTGMMDAWKKQFWPGASRCVGAAATTPVRPINFLDITGTMLLLLSGLLFSFLVFLLEMVVAKAIQKRG